MTTPVTESLNESLTGLSTRPVTETAVRRWQGHPIQFDKKRMTTDKIGLEHKSFVFCHDSKQNELQLKDDLFNYSERTVYAFHDIPSRIL